MNCQDIAHILDNGDTRQLANPPPPAVALHLAACAECASDWELLAGFHQLPDWSPPAGIAAQCRTAVSKSGGPQRGRPVAARYVMAGGVFALAAAAAIIATRGDATRGEGADVPIQAPPAVSLQTVDASVAAAEPPVETAADVEQLDATGSRAASMSADDRFIVGILPLNNEADDAASRAAIDAFYAALLEGLHRVPDLRLVTVESREAVEESVEYLLDVSGTTATRGLRATIRASRQGPEPMVMPIMGQFESECVEQALPEPAVCFDGTGLADSMVSMLRSAVFPVGPTARRELVAKVGERSLAREERLKAFRDLASVRIPAPGSRRMTWGPGLEDPAAIRAAIDLAAAEPAYRAEIWRAMRTVRAPELIEPLLTSARLDADHAVRAEAVVTLAESFIETPQVRRDLELVAQQDPRGLVRALAQRGLSGEEAGWRRHIVTTLKDQALPAEERIEALFHHLNANNSGAVPDNRLNELMDAEAIPALADALTLARGTRAGQRAMLVVVSRLNDIRHPAITELLLADFASEAGMNRSVLLSQIARRRGEARVDALLKEVAANDADPRLREIAAGALAEAASPETTRGAGGDQRGPGVSPP